MQIIIEEKSANLNEVDSIIVGVYSDKLDSPFVKNFDKLSNGQLKGAIGNKEFDGKESTAVMFRIDGNKMIVVGLGDSKVSKGEVIKNAFGNAFSSLKEYSCKTIGVPVFESVGGLDFLSRCIVEGVVIGDYSFNKYKTDNTDPKKQVDKVIVYCQEHNNSKMLIENGVKLGQILADSTNLTRTIANEPANVATPVFVANKAKELANQLKIKYEVFGRKELEKMDANALLAVSAGSVNEPQLIHLEYDGRKNGKGKTIAVVGKGITFDSGGISIKPALKMEEMKFDKSGACAVLGIMNACVKLSVNARIIGIGALSENLPSGSAYKPSDIIKTMSGKTVEVQNTDAEGRMVLSDALTYANKFKPDYIIDLATLTGACVVALGDLTSGLFCNDEEFEKKMIIAGQTSGEKLWSLPVSAEYDEKIKSDIADIKNVGESYNAGASAGASFLKVFAAPTKWAHLDIAGTAWTVRPKGYLGLGSTGMGVRVVTQFIMNETSS